MSRIGRIDAQKTLQTGCNSNNIGKRTSTVSHFFNTNFDILDF